MSWFKVDDGTHSHKKTRRAGVEAMGLWVVCGSWSAAHLEDGFVPTYVAETFTTRAHQYAKRLVSAGLWVPTTKDGDEGWRFHDWDAYQPMRDVVEAKRDAWRERQRKARSQGKVSRSDNVVSHAPVTRESRVSHATTTTPHPTMFVCCGSQSLQDQCFSAYDRNALVAPTSLPRRPAHAAGPMQDKPSRGES